MSLGCESLGCSRRAIDAIGDCIGWTGGADAGVMGGADAMGGGGGGVPGGAEGCEADEMGVGGFTVGGMGGYSDR